MSNEEILTKAVAKAIAGGWDIWWCDMFKAVEGKKDTYLSVEDDHLTLRWLSDDIPLEDSDISIAEIIFSHDFAKALWPWDDSIRCPYCGICLTGMLMHPRPCPFGIAEVFAQPMWHYHLQQMVIADDPIKYLGENI